MVQSGAELFHISSVESLDPSVVEMLNQQEFLPATQTNKQTNKRFLLRSGPKEPD